MFNLVLADASIRWFTPECYRADASRASAARAIPQPRRYAAACDPYSEEGQRSPALPTLPVIAAMRGQG
jgi:hypothetical protein